MKIIPTRTLVCLLTLLATAQAAASLEPAELESTSSGIQSALVTLTLVTEEGKRTDITVPDQGLATLGTTDSGSLLGLRPRVLGGGYVELTLYLAREETDTVRQVGSVTLAIGETQLVQTLGQALIVGASLELSTASSLVAPSSPDSQCSSDLTQSEAFGILLQCCTSCGNDSACGCRVSDDCGNTCCSGFCCQ